MVGGEYSQTEGRDQKGEGDMQCGHESEVGGHK